jgi:protein disulfide-isomerase
MKKLLGIVLVMGIALVMLITYSVAQTNKKTVIKTGKKMVNKKMKVEIWSDMVCPFCYIGKRRYEAALSKFAHANEIEVVWHSFQLNPSLEVNKNNRESVYQYLAKAKGVSYEQSVKMHEGVMKMASEVGLDYRFDEAVVTNSQNAHRVMQMAQQKGLGDEAEELLFKAYFTEGKDLNDATILVLIGEEIGLDAKAVATMLAGNDYNKEVTEDMQEANKLGINGVPFFVFDRKYAVSGAQPVDTFLQTLQAAHAAWLKGL